MKRVSIIDTACSNLASVCAGFERLGARVEVVRSARAVAEAERVVLPGVGSFARGMQRLRELELSEVLRTRCAEGRPLLAICLGMQLLATSSEEAPGVEGLGVVGDAVTRLVAEDRPWPQLSWNRVGAFGTTAAAFPAVEAAFPLQWAFFANGYCFRRPPAAWQCARADYGAGFVAAMRRGALLACQFHPELSGSYGRALLASWLNQDEEGTQTRAALRVIPCLDLDGGRVVKGVRFEELRDAGAPLERALLYESQGADELVLLDISATREARAHATEVVQAIRARVSIPITVGGGVRSVEDAGRLLEAGADKVAVNSAAVERPELLTELAESFGSQCVVASIDAAKRDASAGAWEVKTRSGTHDSGLDAVSWAARASEAGAGELLVTSHDRDGTQSGYDCALLAEIRAVSERPIVASGGASTARDMADAVAAGADAVLAASIFHDGLHSVASIKSELSQLGLELRT